MIRTLVCGETAGAGELIGPMVRPAYPQLAGSEEKINLDQGPAFRETEQLPVHQDRLGSLSTLDMVRQTGISHTCHPSQFTLGDDAG